MHSDAALIGLIFHTGILTEIFLDCARFPAGLWADRKGRFAGGIVEHVAKDAEFR
jgi:hypothetical protein